MKKRVQLIFLASLLLLLPDLSGQSLQSCWDRSFRLGKGETVHAVTQSINGWVAAVGSVEVPGRGLDGFLLIVDPQNGRTLYSQIYGGEGDDAFLDIGQDLYGNFYLAGYSEDDNGRQRSDGWLMYVDIEGVKLEEKFIGTTEEEQFEYLEVLETGGVLLVGRKQKRPEGEIWVVRADEMQIKNQRTIRDERFEDIIGTFLSEDGKVWVGGNQSNRAKRNGKAGWLLQLDAFGNPVREREVVDIRSSHFSELNMMQRSLFNDMVLAGTVIENSQRDALVLQYTQDGQELINLPYGDRREELGVGLLKTVQDYFLVTRQVLSYRAGQAPGSEVVLIDGKKDELVYQIEAAKGFFPISTLYTFDRKILVWGHQPDGRKQHLRAVCIEAEELLAMAKSGSSKIDCSAPQLLDEDRDGILRKGERGVILFDVVNNSNQDLLEGTVEIEGLPLSSQFKTTYLGFISRGSKKQAKIPVNGDMLLNKNLEVVIRLKERGQQVDEFPFTIVSRADSREGSRKLEIITKWETPYSSDTRNNNLPARVAAEQTPIRYEVTSPREFKNTDIRIRKGGVYLEGNKQSGRKFEVSELPNQDWYRYRHTLNLEVPLDTGENVFVIEVWENEEVIKRDTLSFVYEPQRPNLHVVVLGPENVGLKYNTQDALDFAGLMEAQAGSGYFGAVYIDTLVAAPVTTGRKISITFADLKKRYLSPRADKKITENDVLVVFISTHGQVLEENGVRKFKLQPSDYDGDYPKLTTIDYETSILDPLSMIDCKKLVFIDACHSGAAGAKTASENVSKYILELNAIQPGMLSIHSSSYDEYSYENKLWQNGAFTAALEKALKGERLLIAGSEADEESNKTYLAPKITEEDGRKLIAMGDLFEYLSKCVPYLVKQVDPDQQQNPQKKTDRPELERIKFLIKE